MTGLGWIFMSLSWLLIIGLASFCFYTIFKKKEVD